MCNMSIRDDKNGNSVKTFIARSDTDYDFSWTYRRIQLGSVVMLLQLEVHAQTDSCFAAVHSLSSLIPLFANTSAGYI
jgi:hypothetical protein